MPLITCPACQKEVSSQAPTCPQCGHPIAAPTSGRNTSEGLWARLNKPLVPKKLSWPTALLVFLLAGLSIRGCAKLIEVTADAQRTKQIQREAEGAAKRAAERSKRE